LKEKEFDKLLDKMASCQKCTNLKCKNKSLINIYKDKKFCRSVPSIWTDWFNRLNKKIMIIGQDWGPFSEMQKFNGLLLDDRSNWEEIIDLEKSNTKKMLEYYIKTSSNNEYSLDDTFITNAIMCARSGDNYRGNNIDLKNSTMNCSKYLLEQIKIVKPKVILTLGYYPLLSLSNIFNFKIDKTLKEAISNTPEFFVEGFIIIPLYHPVAQIRNSEQLEQYKRIWKYIKKTS